MVTVHTRVLLRSLGAPSASPYDQAVARWNVSTFSLQKMLRPYA